MDFDPDYHIDDAVDDFYGEGSGEEDEDQQIEEFDEMGNPIYMATAAGFGYHMAQDEIEERKIAEDILRRREGKSDTPTKIPLASRHETKGVMTPFGRWATKVNHDPARRDKDLEYTMVEQLQILDAQGGKDDWDG